MLKKTITLGTKWASCRSYHMYDSLVPFVENVVQIAWDVLERSDEISDPNDASRFLVQTVAQLVVKGERRRLILLNRAIDDYRRYKQARAA